MSPRRRNPGRHGVADTLPDASDTGTARFTEPIVWTSNERGVEYLVNAGRLQFVEPNEKHATTLFDEAQRHLQTARDIELGNDVSMAFTAAYEAARKSMTAVLAIQGLRPTGGEGGHSVILDAVRPQFPEEKKVFQQFERMRVIRNHVAYPDFSKPLASREDVSWAIKSSGAIIDVVGRYLALQ